MMRWIALLIVVLTGCSYTPKHKSPPEAVQPFADRLKPMNRILNLMDQGWTVWGCAPIYGPDGKVHVFFARWPHGNDWKAIHWSKPAKGYPSTQELFGIRQRQETPILLMKQGRPDYLFTNRGGSKEDKVFSGFVYKVMPMSEK